MMIYQYTPISKTFHVTFRQLIFRKNIVVNDISRCPKENWKGILNS